MPRSDYYFTVFTPTYNRAHLLHRVYDSLGAQTYRDFEWLIIDDGSTDKTLELVKRWQAENLFPIRYFFQHNQGKHIAWNRAADLASGEYFLCADSDDELVPESLESFRACFESIPAHDRGKFCGVIALCKNPSGVVGNALPPNVHVSNFIELYLNYKIKGDLCYCGRTEIYQQIRFAETFTRSLLPEGTLWFRIARNYKVILLNQPLSIVHAEPDSICHTFSYAKNAQGMRVLSRLLLNDFIIDYWRTALPLFFQNATVYLRSCFHLDIPIVQQIRDLNNIPARVIWALMLPKGLALYFWDKYRRDRHVAN